MTTYHYNEFLQDQMPELWQYAKAYSHDPIRQVAACLQDGQGKVLARGTNILPRNIALDWNDRAEVRKVVLHAEIDCLLRVSLATQRLDECILYVTLEPCLDCRKVIQMLGIREVVYGEKYIPSDARTLP